jgi:heme A synthase
MTEGNSSSGHVRALAWVVWTLMLVLVCLGGFVTTYGAGMAVPDWPLSFGAWNPNRWWEQHHVFLEHSHRLVAQLVGLGVGVLCALVWRQPLALLCAAVCAFVAVCVASIAGLEKVWRVHAGIWPSALAFVIWLIIAERRKPSGVDRALRWVAVAAFVGVCVQAVMGGQRVTLETAGHDGLAIWFRVAHGAFGQVELCLLAVVTAMLGRKAVPGRRSVSGEDALSLN